MKNSFLSLYLLSSSLEKSDFTTDVKTSGSPDIFDTSIQMLLGHLNNFLTYRSRNANDAKELQLAKDLLNLFGATLSHKEDIFIDKITEAFSKSPVIM